ncbi:MAG: hypothetical protein Q4G50_11770 [Corynebacterium sp.]|uniref:hypothetical protein n=1 Tax=Corynebacterium sp. TaxID=1720 RepID=UPI0026DED009|nr:hypothetical protein [Corynebacterium sp.]MDO5670662.1 hypothetical protein [Corynebacterium sp.]
MKYQGENIDQMIAGGSGRLAVKDGMELNAAQFPLPIPLTSNADTTRLIPISAAHGINPEQARPRGLVSHDATHHPKAMQYRADARTRIVAHLWEHPTWIASHFSAAALLGITHFADSADAFVLTRNRLHLTEDFRLATQRQIRRPSPSWTLQLGEHSLLVTPPMLTLAHCLRATLGEEHSWHTPEGLPVSGPHVRAIQVIDRFRREFGLTATDVAEGVRGLLNARRLQQLLELSDDGADSPPETLIRLIARDCAPQYRWQSQVPVYTDGTIGEPGTTDPDLRLLTILDLAAIAQRHYLYYDGEHHLERERRDQDSSITAQLTSWGWTGVRITAGILNEMDLLRSHIMALGPAHPAAA